jgi:ribosomal protein S18 acetylase RimI-like enzyme
MNIRKAESTDMEKIVDLAYEFDEYLVGVDNTLTSEVTPKEVLQKNLSEGFCDPKHDIVVAEVSGEVVGFSDMWAYPEFIHGGIITYLQNLFVTEKYRRSGVGSKLFNAILEQAQERRAVAIHISMKKKNTIAINFYKKQGIEVELMMLERRLA